MNREKEINILPVLQTGAPKCGNFWLYKIIQHVLLTAALPVKSFIQQHPVFPIASTWKLNYPEQSGIDMIDITDYQCFYRIGYIFRMPFDDVDSYLSKTSHVWSHSPFCKRSHALFPKFRKIVYIIRDPRDRAISFSNYVFTPYMMKHFPHGYSSPDQYLDKHLKKLLLEWIWHVFNFMKYSQQYRIHVIFYERLLDNFKKELEELLNYLNIWLTDEQKQIIYDRVLFQNLKKGRTNHLRSGKHGGWIHILTEEQIKLSDQITGPLLDFLSYSRDIALKTPHFPSSANYSNYEDLKNQLISA